MGDDTEEIKSSHGVSFELHIEDYVPFVNPKDYDIDDINGINPKAYFITSGDAVAKAKFMVKEMWSLAKDAKKRYTSKAKHRQFAKETWAAASKCKRFIDKLLEMRGSAIFLECEWRNHVLYVMPKNPRKRDID